MTVPLVLLKTFDNEHVTISAASELAQSAVVSDYIARLHVSSRTKPKAGWESQDRAAISFYSKPVSEATLRQVFQQAAQNTNLLEGGCSCTTLVMLPEHILVAWLGDSPAFLVGVQANTGKIETVLGLNEPHIPLYDQAEIERRGGVVNTDGRLDLKESSGNQESQYSLSMSRAFGNSWLGNLLIKEPSIVAIEKSILAPHLTWYAVVGSDGVLMDSERNLMFPRPKNAKFSENTLITYCAELFKSLANECCVPWTPDTENWAADITRMSQETLQQMEATADKSQVGYAAVDDTTLLIVPILQQQDIPSIMMTVADGHRENGEITAQNVVATIHQLLLAES